MTFTAYQNPTVSTSTYTNINFERLHIQKKYFLRHIKATFFFLQKKSFGAEHAAAKYVYFTSAVHFENCGFFFKRKILDI